MQTQTLSQTETLIPIKKARIIIAMTVVFYIIIGLIIGNLYVWYPNKNVSRYEVEIKDSLKVVQEKPNDINAIINLGFTYMKAKRYDDAKEEYNAALKIDPNSTIALMNMAYLDIETKNYTDADKLLKGLITSEPGFQVYFLEGKSKFMQKRYQDAAQNLLTARDMNPTDTETLYYLGLSYSRLGQKSKAIKTFKSALDFDPNRQDVKNELKKISSK